MALRENIIREIESLPQNLLEEVADFVGYLKLKNSGKKLDITIASEQVLGKDWLRPEEEKAWQKAIEPLRQDSQLKEVVFREDPSLPLCESEWPGALS